MSTKSEVQHVAERSRYEAVEDGQLAGFATYSDVDGVRVFTHTEVFPDFEGHGIGTALVRDALDACLAEGRSIVALCPFVDEFVTNHSEYAELVDAELDTRLRARAD